MGKKLVITADDFGISEDTNTAIKRGFCEGLLTSTCIMANGAAFEHAIEILSDFKEIGMGIHLNIIEGKSLLPAEKVKSLCDAEGFYNKGFVALLSKSSDKRFLQEVEADFRFQIETILNYTHVSHINSHVHTHAIPKIFEITCKLAQEYRINYVRTQTEIPYVIPSVKKHIRVQYPVNLVKAMLLGAFSTVNYQVSNEYGLLTNDYFIGIAYTGNMDENALSYGLKAVKKDAVVEAILHPTVDVSKKDNHREFLSFLNPKLKEETLKNGWELTNYKELSGNHFFDTQKLSLM